MIRLDTAGRDVTDSPGLWSEEDCEIVSTNYPHPDITSGQHTNGPAAIWWRMADADAKWENTGETHMHKVLAKWLGLSGYARHWSCSGRRISTLSLGHRTIRVRCG